MPGSLEVKRSQNDCTKLWQIPRHYDLAWPFVNLENDGSYCMWHLLVQYCLVNILSGHLSQSIGIKSKYPQIIITHTTWKAHEIDQKALFSWKWPLLEICVCKVTRHVTLKTKVCTKTADIVWYYAKKQILISLFVRILVKIKVET